MLTHTFLRLPAHSDPYQPSFLLSNTERRFGRGREKTLAPGSPHSNGYHMRGVVTAPQPYILQELEEALMLRQGRNTTRLNGEYQGQNHG